MCFLGAETNLKTNVSINLLFFEKENNNSN